jgi:hypothetical protein
VPGTASELPPPLAHGAVVPPPPPPPTNGGAGVLDAQGAFVGWSGPLGTAGPVVAHGAAVPGIPPGILVLGVADGSASGSRREEGWCLDMEDAQGADVAGILVLGVAEGSVRRSCSDD